MIGAIDWVGLFSAMGTLAIDVLQAINGILDQVDWGAVGQKIMECIEAVDWAGILSQLGEIIDNLWPMLMTIIGASLLPIIGGFVIDSVLAELSKQVGIMGVQLLGKIAGWIVGTMLPTILSGLTALITAIVSAIGLWPATIIAVLLILGAAIIACLAAHWDEIKQKVRRNSGQFARKSP